MVRVAKDGTVGVTYYDFRHPTSTGSGTTDSWLVHCPASTADCTLGGNWSETGPIGPAFDMLAAPNAFGLFTADYEGLTVVGGNQAVGACSASQDCSGFHPLWVKTQGSGPATSNPDPTNVFTARIGP
jgi:hypothetical protein